MVVYFIVHMMSYTKELKLVRWYGIDRNPKGRTDFRCEADIPEWGFKFHMNDVCSSLEWKTLNT